MALEVEIQTRLPGFTLEVGFTCDRQPIGILGASGAGKSMTLRSIAGLETPTTGRIALDERVLFDSAAGINVPSRERRVGLVFQHYALFPHLTVEQNVAFGLRHLEALERKRRTSERIAAMHLSGFEQRHPGTLSGGEQQRVALARALAPQPAALLLDEPFSAMDTHLRSQVERQLRETLSSYSGTTLLVSHNLEEIYRLCGELVVLDQGRVIARGSREEIFRHPCNRRTAQLTGCKNFSRAKASTGYSIEAPDWGCGLQVSQELARVLGHVAIRAHHIYVGPHEVLSSVPPPNTFPGWLVDSTEGPFRVTLYLRLHAPATSSTDYHLQAEISLETWLELRACPQPWSVRLDPQRLILLPD